MLGGTFASHLRQLCSLPGPVLMAQAQPHAPLHPLYPCPSLQPWPPPKQPKPLLPCAGPSCRSVRTRWGLVIGHPQTKGKRLPLVHSPANPSSREKQPGLVPSWNEPPTDQGPEKPTPWPHLLPQALWSQVAQDRAPCRGRGGPRVDEGEARPGRGDTGARSPLRAVRASSLVPSPVHTSMLILK